MLLTVQSTWNLAHKVGLIRTRYTSWVRPTHCVCAGPGCHACPSPGAWYCEKTVIGNPAQLSRDGAAAAQWHWPTDRPADRPADWVQGGQNILANITDSWINMTGNHRSCDPFRWKRLHTQGKWITMSKGNNNCMYMLWTNYWVSSGGTSAWGGTITV